MAGQVIIGGSQSTGSSLLVNILDRHSAISAGPETYLFMHPRLYTQWGEYKKYLIHTRKWGGLKSEGWFLMNGAQLEHCEYGWNKDQLKELIAASVNLPTFATAFMSKRLKRTDSRVWVEKSPANVSAFPYFLSTFPNSRVIHTTRDPYDTVVSLIARGYSPYYAAGAYIVHTALALRVKDDSRHHLIKYEDLVLEPYPCVNRLLNFMDLSWEEEILEPGVAEKNLEIKLNGWLQNEKAGIGLKSLGRFNRLSEKHQLDIINALALFTINPAYARRHAIHHISLKSICKVLGYHYLEVRDPDRKALARQKKRDQWTRFLRFYPGYGNGYPGGLV